MTETSASKSLRSRAEDFLRNVTVFKSTCEAIAGSSSHSGVFESVPRNANLLTNDESFQKALRALVYTLDPIAESLVSLVLDLNTFPAFRLASPLTSPSLPPSPLPPPALAPVPVPALPTTSPPPAKSPSLPTNFTPTFMPHPALPPSSSKPSSVSNSNPSSSSNSNPNSSSGPPSNTPATVAETPAKLLTPPKPASSGAAVKKKAPPASKKAAPAAKAAPPMASPGASGFGPRGGSAPGGPGDQRVDRDVSEIAPELVPDVMPPSDLLPKPLAWHGIVSKARAAGSVWDGLLEEDRKLPKARTLNLPVVLPHLAIGEKVSNEGPTSGKLCEDENALSSKAMDDGACSSPSSPVEAKAPFQFTPDYQILNELFFESAQRKQLAAEKSRSLADAAAMAAKQRHATILDPKRTQMMEIAIKGLSLPEDDFSLIEKAVLDINLGDLTAAATSAATGGCEGWTICADRAERLLSLIPSPDDKRQLDKLVASLVPDKSSTTSIGETINNLGGDTPVTEYLKRLSKADRFMYMLTKIPRLEKRLQSILTFLSFPRDSGQLADKLSRFSGHVLAALDPKNVSLLKPVLALLVKIGNYINWRSKRPLIYGVQASVLENLRQFKSVDNKKNLLRVLAEHVDDQWPLPPVNASARVDPGSTNESTVVSTTSCAGNVSGKGEGLRVFAWIAGLLEVADFSSEDVKRQVGVLQTRLADIRSELTTHLASDKRFVDFYSSFLARAEERLAFEDGRVKELTEKLLQFAALFGERTKNPAEAISVLKKVGSFGRDLAQVQKELLNEKEAIEKRRARGSFKLTRSPSFRLQSVASRTLLPDARLSTGHPLSHPSPNEAGAAPGSGSGSGALEAPRRRASSYWRRCTMPSDLESLSSTQRVIRSIKGQMRSDMIRNTNSVEPSGSAAVAGSYNKRHSLPSHSLPHPSPSTIRSDSHESITPTQASHVYPISSLPPPPQPPAHTPSQPPSHLPSHPPSQPPSRPLSQSAQKPKPALQSMPSRSPPERGYETASAGRVYHRGPRRVFQGDGPPPEGSEISSILSSPLRPNSPVESSERTPEASSPRSQGGGALSLGTRAAGATHEKGDMKERGEGRQDEGRLGGDISERVRQSLTGGPGVLRNPAFWPLNPTSSRSVGQDSHTRDYSPQSRGSRTSLPIRAGLSHQAVGYPGAVHPSPAKLSPREMDLLPLPSFESMDVQSQRFQPSKVQQAKRPSERDRRASLGFALPPDAGSQYTTAAIDAALRAQHPSPHRASPEPGASGSPEGPEGPPSASGPSGGLSTKLGWSRNGWLPGINSRFQTGPARLPIQSVRSAYSGRSMHNRGGQTLSLDADAMHTGDRFADRTPTHSHMHTPTHSDLPNSALRLSEDGGGGRVTQYPALSSRLSVPVSLNHHSAPRYDPSQRHEPLQRPEHLQWPEHSQRPRLLSSQVSQAHLMPSDRFRNEGQRAQMSDRVMPPRQLDEYRSAGAENARTAERRGIDRWDEFGYVSEGRSQTHRPDSSVNRYPNNSHNDYSYGPKYNARIGKS